MIYSGESSAVSVSELAFYLRNALESDDLLQNMWVHGEVSNCKTYPSGHCYFTLKEGEAQLSCVFFKNARLRTSAPDLQDGIALAANGHISFYECNGKLQLYVEAVKPLGEGELFTLFEQLKARLAAEGLFALERKRPLPARPAVIGIVTSPQAAALRDMIRVLRQRYPLAQVVLAPAQVQGADASSSLVAALDLLNEHGKADLIIIGRGGGSIEDLWAFNDEEVARAIARSRIPIISGIGHETDFTIADFVADHRASTPTAAATLAVPDIEDWRIDILEKQQLLTVLMREYINHLYADLEQTKHHLTRLSPIKLTEQLRQKLDDNRARLQTQISHRISIHGEQLRGLALQLHSLSPLLTLARGYAIARRDDNQQIITHRNDAQPGDYLTIQVQDGTIPVEVRR